MGEPGRLRHTAEAVGIIAVVLSLVYVGLEVRQNTSAIQTSTSQSVYAQFMDATMPALENPELAELIVRADTAPNSLSRADSLRYDLYLTFGINVYEAVYTSLEQGTMEPGIAAAWLDGMSYWSCAPGARAYWSATAEAYAPGFRAAMDSVVSTTRCPP